MILMPLLTLVVPLFSWGPYRGANCQARLMEEDVSDFARYGGNLLRVGFNSMPLVSKQPPYEFNQAAFDALDRMLGWCAKYHVAVIIDPHTTPGTEVTTTVRPQDPFMHDFAWHEHLIRLWTYLAKRYRDRGAVIAGYDLLNEPSLPDSGKANTPADWNLLVRKLVKAIRASDRVHPIVIEPPTLRTADGRRVNRLDGMSYLEPPPDSNVVYSPHMYEPHAFTHQGVQGRAEGVSYPGEAEGRRWDRKELERIMEPVVRFQKKYKVPIFLGEFSAPRWKGEDANRYLRDVIEICEANGWSWAYHAYREADVWDAERSNTSRDEHARLPSTARLELLREFWQKDPR